MKPTSSYLGFLDRFSLRQLLVAWMAVVLIGSTLAPIAYGWSHRNMRLPSVGAGTLGVGYGFVALILAGALLTWVLGWAISKSVTHQVRSVTRMAQQLEMRDFKEYPIAIPPGDLGEVTRAFLDMRRAISGYQMELRTALDQLREANYQLGQSEAFLRALVESASVGILTQDPDSHIVSSNPFLQRLLGYSAEELIGKSQEDLLDPQDYEAFHQRLSEFYGQPIYSGQSLRAAMRTLGTFPPQELNLISWDGAKVPVQIAVSLLPGENGATLGQLSVVTDLTALKVLETELREREAEALAGSRAKSAFLAAMSHEVRTPLIGINGMIEVLSMGNLDEEQGQDVNILHHSAQSLLQIIGDILDFSKIEAGKLELASETISIPEVVEACVANFAQTASSKGLQIHYGTRQSIGPAHLADPLRLQQILSNFLSNAVKFTPEGHITIGVQCLDSTPYSEKLLFEVRDTGIGISEENQAKLFQPFSQAERDTTRRFGGTGLGLVICRHLSELMGGEITLQSALGKGTIMAFTATFPLGDERDIVRTKLPDRRSITRFIRPKPSLDEALLERSLILLVEDHPTNRAVLTRQLNLAGFALELAEDGVDAFEQWKSGRHAVVLTDLHMPRMDGYQLTSAVRQWEREQGLVRTPIIALTANVMGGEADRCLELGMDDYMAKPVGIPVLVAKLRKWLPHLVWLPSPREPESSLETGKALSYTAPFPSELDDRTLLALGGNDPVAAHEILQVFRSATEVDLRLLAQYFDQGDLSALARQAHRIRGACAMVGAKALAQSAMELEASAMKGDGVEIRSLMNRMQELFEGLAIVE